MNFDILMNGTQSGKSFVFFFGIGLISVTAIVKFWVSPPRPTNAKISILDFLLLAFILYLFFRNDWAELTGSLLFLELVGLAVLYIIIRQLSLQSYLWIFMALTLGGLVQAIYGNLQLWGYFPSHHGIFKMTGSFFNPGPYAGYLATIFPISLGLYLLELKIEKFDRLIVQLFDRLKPLQSRFLNPLNFLTIINSKFLIKGFALSTIISILLVLPASRSRAAWLAVIVSLLYLVSAQYSLYQKLKFYFNTPVKKMCLLVSFLVMLTVAGAGLYHFKKGSADGRVLIWKVSIEMIKDKPIFGYGYDGFKRYYMDFQAEYFENNPDTKDALVAGDTNYAFNESLQLAVEHGVIGIILITTIILLVFFVKSNFQPLKNEKYEIENENIGLSFHPDLKHAEEKESDWFILPISRAVILSIVVFGLFSYPLQILPIKICLVVALAMVANSFRRKLFINFHDITYFSNSFRLFVKSIISIGLLLILATAFLHIQQVKNAYIQWKNAYDLYNYGIYADCLKDYEKAYLKLKTNGDLLTNYGKALSMAEKHAEAAIELLQAARYYPNTVVYTAIGDSYKELGKINQAEQAYLHAWQMNPSRFYPKYLLTKLYDETGQKAKATDVAKELLYKDIKIESTAIKEIKEEMKKIIEKGGAEK
jgi:O-antigen ligase